MLVRNITQQKATNYIYVYVNVQFQWKKENCLSVKAGITSHRKHYSGHQNYKHQDHTPRNDFLGIISTQSHITFFKRNELGQLFRSQKLSFDYLSGFLSHQDQISINLFQRRRDSSHSPLQTAYLENPKSKNLLNISKLYS